MAAKSTFGQVLDGITETLGERADPLPGYNFAVYIKEPLKTTDIVKASVVGAAQLMKGNINGASGAADDLLMTRCAECSGLSSNLDTITYKEGGRNDYEHTFFGPARYPPLVLRRGITDEPWWEWYEDAMNGKRVRKSGSIFMKDASGKLVMGWQFFSALPVKWTGPEFRAGSSGVAFESIELVHRGLLFSKGGSF